MNILQNLEPKKVFKYFEEISQIPRGSGNEKAISDYLVSVAKNLNLEVVDDFYTIDGDEAFEGYRYVFGG